VVGAEQPSLDQAGHQVDHRQAEDRVAPVGADIERLLASAVGAEPRDEY
jgi:hypothetical protein